MHTDEGLPFKGKRLVPGFDPEEPRKHHNELRNAWGGRLIQTFCWVTNNPKKVRRLWSNSGHFLIWDYRNHYLNYLTNTIKILKMLLVYFSFSRLSFSRFCSNNTIVLWTLVSFIINNKETYFRWNIYI